MAFRSSSTEHLAFDSSLTKTCCKMETVIWKFIAIVSLVIAFIALIVGIVAIDQTGTATPSTPQNPTGGNPKSCKEVRGSSGLYMIKPVKGAPSFQVYCDMESSGGGWTLVASIHENNIDGKCTAGDKWSSEQGTANPRGSKNWENKNVFGQLETITNQDYKNPAYYNVPASDIMLWHVPNEMKIYEIKDQAFLKYHTTNKVLNGSTLQELYKTKLPLKTAVGGLHPLIKSINESSSEITALVPNWYNYRYDGNRNSPVSIRDGGGDMYDGGNRVSFQTDRENFTQMVYNTPYFLYGSGLEVKSGAGYPFVALAWIGKGFKSIPNPIQYFDFKVQSNYGADGAGGWSTFPNQPVTHGQFTGMFTAFNVVNTSDPSVCEVFFYISSKRVWQSTPPTDMQKISWGNTTRDATNVVRFTGSPTNVLIGYTLLSKGRGKPVTVQEVEAVVRKYMTLAAAFDFQVTVPHVVAPVNFVLGNKTIVMNSIPSVHRENVAAGYIQFRAFNSVGLPNALCPGVSVNSDNPEQMCIGGTSTAARDISQCGDFAGWSGISGDPGTQESPSRTGKSLNDINSSILIFTK